MEPLPVDTPQPGAGESVELMLVRLAMKAVDAFMEAVQSRNYLLAAGIALTVSVSALRVLFPRLPPQFVPLASAALASLPTLALVLSKPGVQLSEVVVTAVLAWLASAGAWENGIKPVKSIWVKWRNGPLLDPPTPPPASNTPPTTPPAP